MALIFKITIDESSKPPIWREVKTNEEMNFEDFHLLIQKLFGWENYHLFQFSPRGMRSYPVITSQAMDFDGPPSNPKSFPKGQLYEARKIKLSQYFNELKKKMIYLYDFGDNWSHTIELVEKTDEKLPYPVCLQGKGSDLTEDCGGIWGFYEMVDAINDPKHPDHEDMMEWMGMEEGDTWDLNEFDCAEKNLKLQYLYNKN